MTECLPLPTVQAHPEKYAHVERERRFLLSKLPPGLMPQSEYRRVTDRYLTGTNLRLRHVHRPASGQNLWKLTQKLRASPDGITNVLTTTIYLTEQEYGLFVGLAGQELRKDRFLLHHDGRLYGIDVFRDALSGLILAETECASDEELAFLTPPDFAALDVSHEEAFTGGTLASLGPAEAQELLGKFRA